jgi:hypothetical protein
MDPLSLIGGISASGAIIAVISNIIQNLSDARRKFNGADLSIRLLITELIAIKAALTQIQEWAQYNMEDGPAQKELVEGFRASLDGCEVAMEVLAEDVTSLVSKNPFLRRTTYVWNEASMKEHQSRLHFQLAALQLLLQAAQWSVSVPKCNPSDNMELQPYENSTDQFASPAQEP